MGVWPQKYDYKCFWGQMPFFSRGAHTFLFLNGFVIRFKITWDKKNGPFRLKSGYLTPKTLKSCFWGLKPIFSPVTPTSFFLNRFQMWFDTTFEEKIFLLNEKMAIWPLEHLKNALFSRIAPKQIYFWPYSVKRSCLEYQKPHVEDGHWPLAWRQKWRAVPYTPNHWGYQANFWSGI